MILANCNFTLYVCACPDDVRHDVYLTLCNGLFNKGTKRADKNVQVDVEVLNDKDEVLEVGSTVLCVKKFRLSTQMWCYITNVVCKTWLVLESAQSSVCMLVISL